MPAILVSLTYLLLSLGNHQEKKCIAQTAILIDSDFKSDKTYYFQALIAECKCKVSKNGEIIKRYIFEDLTDCDSDSDPDSAFSSSY